MHLWYSIISKAIRDGLAKKCFDQMAGNHLHLGDKRGKFVIYNRLPYVNIKGCAMAIYMKLNYDGFRPVHKCLQTAASNC